MKPSFEVSIETDHRTGEIMVVYLQVRRGKVAKTKELVDGTAFADYNAKGELLGVEFLAPCSVNLSDKISDAPDVKKFIRQKLPTRSQWAAAAPC